MLIVQAILRDQRTVLSVSSLIRDYQGLQDVSLSLPTVIDRRGVENIVRLELDADEVERLRHSAAVLKRTIQCLGLG
jgi:L-lactate dehydrogenase